MRIPEKAPDFFAAMLKGEPLPGRPLRPDRLATVFAAARDSMLGNRYYHWDDLRYRRPPGGVTREEWWFGLKMVRAPLYKPVALTDKANGPFVFGVPDLAQRRLHFIDQNLSGQIGFSEIVASPSTRDRYVVSSLIEEAITSSQLEGASTTRKVATDMIRSGRSPRDKSERMILNNYVAMEQVGALREEPLTPDLVLELHRVVSRDTLSSREAEGRLQAPEDERVLVWSHGVSPRILHSPPSAAELPARLQLMCDFANGRCDNGFIHPVIRAIILHFCRRPADRSTHGQKMGPLTVR